MLPKQTLSLAERLSVLNKLDSGSSERAVAEEYGVGKGTINRIKNNKDSILKAADTMDDEVLKKRKHAVSTAQQDHIEKAVVEFLRLARNAETKNDFTVTGPMLRLMALEEAKRIGIDNFQASDGWLTRVKERHGIKGKVLSGEASAVDPVVIDNWQTRLAEIILDYCEEDIFNCDETGLFWLQSSSRSLVLPGDSAHGGKVDKKRLTLLLCSSWMGEKIKPLLIWKSENPRALNGVDKKKLPVTYRSQKKAWMNTTLFNEWLKSFNSKMETQGRKVLLLMDNATVHAGFDKDKLKAINVAFFPANSTSVTQPMDQGIIQSFKLNYRNQLHIHIMHNLKNNMDSNPMKDISIAQAIVWIFRAWSTVKSRTISRCFARCGFKKGVHGPADDIEPLVQMDSDEVILQAEEMEEDLIFPPLLTLEQLMQQAQENVTQRLVEQLDENPADQSDDDGPPPLPIPPNKTIINAIQAIQFYAMARGDEHVLSGPVDLAKYLELVSARQIAEQVQPQITSYFDSDSTDNKRPRMTSPEMHDEDNEDFTKS